MPDIAIVKHIVIGKIAQWCGFLQKCINADGKVNLADVVLLQKWLLGVPETKLADWRAGDLYADGVLNGFDLCLLRHTVTSSGNI